MNLKKIDFTELSESQKERFFELYIKFQEIITDPKFHRGTEKVRMIKILGEYEIRNIEDFKKLMRHWWFYEKNKVWGVNRMIIEMSHLLWVDVHEIKISNHSFERLVEFQKDSGMNCFNPNDQTISAIKKFHIIMFDFQKIKQS